MHHIADALFFFVNNANFWKKKPHKVFFQASKRFFEYRASIVPFQCFNLKGFLQLLGFCLHSNAAIFLLKMPYNGIVFLFVLAFARVHPFSSSVLNFAIWKKNSSERRSRENSVYAGYLSC